MNWYKTAETEEALRNVGVEVQNGKAVLYRGSDVPNLSESDLRYGDFLSSTPEGTDATGNAGADSYGKYVVKYIIPIKDIEISNGELQYKGNSYSTQGDKYPREIYRAYNDYYGSNYTSKQIDDMDYDHIRGVASMALSEGTDEFDRLMGK
jgi:hypothetical protein